MQDSVESIARTPAPTGPDDSSPADDPTHVKGERSDVSTPQADSTVTLEPSSRRRKSSLERTGPGPLHLTIHGSSRRTANNDSARYDWEVATSAHSNEFAKAMNVLFERFSSDLKNFSETLKATLAAPPASVTPSPPCEPEIISSSDGGSSSVRRSRSPVLADLMNKSYRSTTSESSYRLSASPPSNVSDDEVCSSDGSSEHSSDVYSDICGNSSVGASERGERRDTETDFKLEEGELSEGAAHSDFESENVSGPVSSLDEAENNDVNSDDETEESVCRPKRKRSLEPSLDSSDDWALTELTKKYMKKVMLARNDEETHEDTARRVVEAWRQDWGGASDGASLGPGFDSQTGKSLRNKTGDCRGGASESCDGHCCGHSCVGLSAYNEISTPHGCLCALEKSRKNASSGLVVLRDMPIYSHCEHHLAGMFGKVTVAYFPGKKLVGLSKLPRFLQQLTRGLHLQEILTKKIADEIERQLQPLGVFVAARMRHLCLESRGVRVTGTETVTSITRGHFQFLMKQQGLSETMGPSLFPSDP